MPVYVDALVPCIQSKKWPYPESCHLFADTTRELTDLAGRIGLRFDWIQVKRSEFIHFDLTGAKRQQAIAAGAIPVDRRFVWKYMKAKARNTWSKKNSIL